MQRKTAKRTAQEGFILVHLILVVFLLGGMALMLGSFVNRYKKKVYRVIAQQEERFRQRSIIYEGMSVLAQDDPEVDSMHEDWFRENLTSDSEGDQTRLVIEDECGKLDINQLASKSSERREQYERYLRSLFKKVGLSHFESNKLVEAFRQSVPLKRWAKFNLICHSVDLSSIELRRFVTPYSNGKVNINTAPREVLEVLLEERGALLIKDILKSRAHNPFSDLREIDFQGEDRGGLDIFTTRSSFFSIQAWGENPQIESQINVIVERRLGELEIKEWIEK